MNEEISKILKMVEEGKITSEKAGQLIESLNPKNKSIETFQSTSNDADIMNKMLKIKVTSHDGDDVNVNLPIKFIKTMLKTIGKIPITDNIKGMENLDLNLISDAIDNNLSGKIVDVKSANGDLVEVSIE
ncbi:hypothetical protein Ccar_05825 [Clostridium carboxidivorans P7]|uniref:YvlB/LiaX N-terminal domain-containing protein n=1 Tax=Clostridium carboxidivorans P7 TaxID=536227 RepID=C6PPM0_9CLOT|nr:hypothetical protein [Clostridium carboxidivorans]AKN30365.1 hypothetical protein Ccar_05825 [Clostridium carboxidivorans P7]EET88750.1 conserved hypothetical protein [Clostridium carboxidivorans P7]